MMTRSKTRLSGDNCATMCSLPNDILAKIIRELDFQDNCSLQLLGKPYHALLSNLAPEDGLWGRCDLMRDLHLTHNFGRKEDIMKYVSCFPQQFRLPFGPSSAPLMNASGFCIRSSLLDAFSVQKKVLVLPHPAAYRNIKMCRWLTKRLPGFTPHLQHLLRDQITS